jgi:hypothetical protein
LIPSDVSNTGKFPQHGISGDTQNVSMDLTTTWSKLIPDPIVLNIKYVFSQLYAAMLALSWKNFVTIEYWFNNVDNFGDPR